MSLLMSCIMSLIITLFNLGLVGNLPCVWLRAWALAFVVSFPVIIVVSPAVQKLVNMVMKDS